MTLDEYYSIKADVERELNDPLFSYDADETNEANEDTKDTKGSEAQSQVRSVN